MAWKLGIFFFLAATLIMALGPLAIHVVGALIALIIVGVILTLTVTSIFAGRRGSDASGGDAAAGSRSDGPDTEKTHGSARPDSSSN